MTEALAGVAPGRPLREGLDRILQANMGALIVVGDGPEVLAICSGGFLLDAEFTPQRLSELAKMDGAIILAPDASRIARANVHLVPNPHVPPPETGTDGRLVLLQLEELMGGVEDDRRLVIKDYFHPADDWQLSHAMSALADLSTEDLLDLKSVTSVLHLATEASELDLGMQPRGYRLLSK